MEKNNYRLCTFATILILGIVGLFWGIGPFSDLGKSTNMDIAPTESPLLKKYVNYNADDDSDDDDSGDNCRGSSSGTQSAIVRCPFCTQGRVYDFYGNSYLCSTCGGVGVITVSNGSDVSFTGGRYKCRSHGCDCEISRSLLEADDLNYCGCGHSVAYHHD